MPSSSFPADSADQISRSNARLGFGGHFEGSSALRFRTRGQTRCASGPEMRTMEMADLPAGVAGA